VHKERFDVMPKTTHDQHAVSLVPSPNIEFFVRVAFQPHHIPDQGGGKRRSGMADFAS
jgi:hypothetical protein